jgi:hypothetical protein
VSKLAEIPVVETADLNYGYSTAYPASVMDNMDNAIMPSSFFIFLPPY